MSYFIIIFGSILLSAFFSGMEIAFISANKLRIELEKKQGGLAAKVVSIFTRNPNRYIATMLVGNNIALVVYGIVMAIVLEPLVLRVTDSEGSILLIQTIISTLVILLTGEFLPKTLFRINPNRVLNVFSYPVLAFYVIFYPISGLTIWISNNVIQKILKKDVSQRPDATVFGRIDLDHLLHEGTTDNTYAIDTEHEIKIFQNALTFSTLKVRDCMIPRTDIVAVNVEATIEELKQRFVETGFSKILVYDSKIDNIIGYISHKELFKMPGDIRSHLFEISFVPETMSARNLLADFIKEQRGIAVVVDEFGGVSGMLTIEDIIEEIFGDIEDEHDTTELIEQQLSDREFIVSGRQEIDYLNEKFGLNLPESDEYDTVAGLVIYHSEKLPNLNEQIMVGKIRFKVLKVTQTRIELVGIELKD